MPRAHSNALICRNPCVPKGASIRRLSDIRICGGPCVAEGAADGKSVSDWSIASGTLTLKVTLSAGTSATVKIPTPTAIQSPLMQSPPPLPPSSGTYTFQAPA